MRRRLRNRERFTTTSGRCIVEVTGVGDHEAVSTGRQRGSRRRIRTDGQSRTSSTGRSASTVREIGVGDGAGRSDRTDLTRQTRSVIRRSTGLLTARPRLSRRRIEHRRRNIRRRLRNRERFTTTSGTVEVPAIRERCLERVLARTQWASCR